MPPRFYFPSSGAQCRACTSAAAHAASIRREYDLTAAEYDALLTLQDGRCAICRQRPVTVRLAVDHDHATGAVRGLLCSRCNHDLLGSSNDSADRLRAAVNYLDTPPMSGNWVAPTLRARQRRRGTDPAEVDPSYLMFDHDREDAGLPPILEAVRKRMTVDQLILSGGRSDPENPHVYWLAYRRAADEVPPWDADANTAGYGSAPSPAGEGVGEGAGVRTPGQGGP